MTVDAILPSLLSVTPELRHGQQRRHQRSEQLHESDEPPCHRQNAVVHAVQLRVHTPQSACQPARSARRSRRGGKAPHGTPQEYFLPCGRGARRGGRFAPGGSPRAGARSPRPPARQSAPGRLGEERSAWESGASSTRIGVAIPEGFFDVPGSAPPCVTHSAVCRASSTGVSPSYSVMAWSMVASWSRHSTTACATSARGMGSPVSGSEPK